MIDSFKAFFVAFQRTKSLSHTTSTDLKSGAFKTNVIGLIGAIVVIAKGFGYDVQIEQDTINQLGGGIAAALLVGNAIVHVVTTTKIGLPPMGSPGGDDPATSGPGSGSEPGP